MQPIVYHGIKKEPGRKIAWDDLEFVGDYVEALKVGQRVTCSLGAFHVPKSAGRHGENGNQLGFFFGKMIPIIMDEIFFTRSREEAYICTLQEVSYELVENPNGGHPRKRLVHLSGLDMPKMSKFIEDCQMWAAQEHGVYLPDPDPRKSKRNLARFKAQNPKKNGGVVFRSAPPGATA